MAHIRDAISVRSAASLVGLIAVISTAGVLTRATFVEGARVREVTQRAENQVAALQRDGAILASRLDQALARLDERESEVLASFAQGRDALRAELASSRSDGFRSLHDQWRESVYLVYSEIPYRIGDDPENVDVRSVWGTAFVVSQDGHLVTSKHVAQPWKYDADLQAMAAMGEIEILEDQWRIAVWPVSARCLDHMREPNWITAFTNHGRGQGKLTLETTAADILVEHSLGFAGEEVSYLVHEVENDQDLALLKLHGGSFRPVPLVVDDTVATLDRVMVLGYPRGEQGLERGCAVPSASVGVVRKAERTIQVTASIMPGNSGSPIFSSTGKVVGIATRIHSETLGICLRARHVRALLASVRADEDSR